MTEVKSTESQQELFTQFSQEPRRHQRFPSLAKSHKPILLTVTLEQILLASILLTLVLCFVFFLGILRGKSTRVASPAVYTAPVVTVSRSIATQAQGTAPLKTLAAQPAPMLPAAAGVGRPKVTVDDPAKPYSIQLVTYKKKDYADKEVGSLKRLGFFSTVIQRGEYFEVRAGQYATAEEAKKDLAYFSSKYKGCFLCRR
jgi:septal ring-binding cell division protein DamX